MLFILYIIADASESLETIGQEISLGKELYIYMYIVLFSYIHLIYIICV